MELSQNKRLLRGQCGLSLVELMISLTLTSVLMAGLVEVYVGVRSAENSQLGLSRMQESGRFALYYLSESTQRAGYLGCLSGISADEINNTLDGPPVSFEPEKSIQGWEAVNTAPGDISNSIDGVAVTSTNGGGWVTSDGNVLETTSAIPGTDIIRLWGSSDEFDINSISPGAATVVNTEVFEVDDEEILLLSDCENADLVQACNVQQVGNPATLNLTLSAGCDPGNIPNMTLGVNSDGKVARLTGTVYYIGKRDDDASNPPALFQRRLSATGVLGPAEELIEGVANMQILYGETLDNDNRNSADAYLPANLVTDWNNIVSVRISLLVESIENFLASSPQAYTFNGVTYDSLGGNGTLPDDRRRRRVFTTTLSLRNKVL